jgi:hypothetical protein
MWDKVIEGVITTSILTVIAAFIGLFIHVQALDARQQETHRAFELIRTDLIYIRGRVDSLYEKNK